MIALYPIQYMGNLHNSKQRKSFLIKVLLQKTEMLTKNSIWELIMWAQQLPKHFYNHCIIQI